MKITLNPSVTHLDPEAKSSLRSHYQDVAMNVFDPESGKKVWPKNVNFPKGGIDYDDDDDYFPEHWIEYYGDVIIVSSKDLKHDKDFHDARHVITVYSAHDGSRRHLITAPLDHLHWSGFIRISNWILYKDIWDQAKCLKLGQPTDDINVRSHQRSHYNQVTMATVVHGRYLLSVDYNDLTPKFSDMEHEGVNYKLDDFELNHDKRYVAFFPDGSGFIVAEPKGESKFVVKTNVFNFN